LNEREHIEQVSLFKRIAMSEEKYSELKTIFAVPNGGKRAKLTAYKLKEEGAKAGVPDILVPIRGWEYGNMGYVELLGLWIEMKVKPNKPTESQNWWLKELEKNGYRTVVCYSWIEAWNEIVKYLGLPREEMES
jgi:hypothetical protein